MPLATLLRRHNIYFHIYATIYLEFRVSFALSTQQAIRALETCVVAVRRCMSQNMLKLNDGKSEFLITHPRSVQACMFTITVSDTTTQPSGSVRNLGVIFDSEVSLHQHVESLCRGTYYYM